jgi:hypothetical protein
MLYNQDFWKRSKVNHKYYSSWQVLGLKACHGPKFSFRLLIGRPTDLSEPLWGSNPWLQCLKGGRQYERYTGVG